MTIIFLPAISDPFGRSATNFDCLAKADIFIFLAATSLYHAIAILSTISPVEAPWKKPLMKFLQFLQAKLRVTHFNSAVILCAITWYSYEFELRNLASFTSFNILLSFIIYKSAEEPIKAIGIDGIIERDLNIERKKMLQWQPPCQTFFKAILTPTKLILGSEWFGLENITKESEPENDIPRPALYVMNHTRYGIDMGTFAGELYEQTGVYPRGLADHAHFALPHGYILKHIFGAVDGTRGNVDALMEGRANILVYPGGAQEIMKPSTVENYSLMWKDRLGFCRLAIKHGYDIIPVSCVGPEDMMDVLYDFNLEALRRGQYFPVPAPLNPFKIQKLYFAVGKRISTSCLRREDYTNDEIAREVRDKTRGAVMEGIDFLKAHQCVDPERYLFQRTTNAFCSLLPKSTDVTSEPFEISKKILTVAGQVSKAPSAIDLNGIEVDDVISLTTSDSLSVDEDSSSDSKKLTVSLIKKDN